MPYDSFQRDREGIRNAEHVIQACQGVEFRVNNAGYSSCALVVGLCSHGLAITRSLHRQGVEVHAFEANPSIPGALTNSANIHFVESIKENSLVDALLAFRRTVPRDRSIVLFPTNDCNVRIIAEHIDQLSGPFVLSWTDCAETVQRLLLKTNIEKRCIEVGLKYPKSAVLNNGDNLISTIAALSCPFIIKPANPQSGFKAIKCESVAELESVVSQYHRDHPFIIQEWLSGTDKDLFFCALYLDRGRSVATFMGNKLESYPPALGQTTAAISVELPELLLSTEVFFEGLGLSGPVSLEFKRDAEGQFWVIEPTVGRSDFWLGLCIGGGCDLPMIEFEVTLNSPLDPRLNKRQPVIWFDSERDVLAPFKHLSKMLLDSQGYRKPVFSFFVLDDLRPFFRCLRRSIFRVVKSAFNRLTGRLGC